MDDTWRMTARSRRGRCRQRRRRAQQAAADPARAPGEVFLARGFDGASMGEIASVVRRLEGHALRLFRQQGEALRGADGRGEEDASRRCCSSSTPKIPTCARVLTRARRTPFSTPHGQAASTFPRSGWSSAPRRSFRASARPSTRPAPPGHRAAERLFGPPGGGRPPVDRGSRTSQRSISSPSARRRSMKRLLFAVDTELDPAEIETARAGSAPRLLRAPMGRTSSDA